ncbi:hypothetical protein G6O67_005401 [Ophiocordyceps sinensis]|uniref:Probable kinetochore protein NUF2 n=2 Tax=Ophiocordyceps sinensis TaxID=72228 RepID=A0A8H4PRK6_9HYPO|nr:Kinetochore protein Nuf2 [Ophiocordyceps sinensis CO18]KAF4509098.1 hypothetical protein G6O67_005401 [Ophiocordyceps sinensis]
MAPSSAKRTPVAMSYNPRKSYNPQKSFNPRKSILPIPTSQQHQQQHQQQPLQGRGRRKDDDADLMLPDHEIAGCIADIGINFSVADLHKPNPAQVQQIFEWCAELLVNATRKTVEPAMGAAADDVCGNFADIVPVDVRNLMGFYESLRRLLLACGISDICFNDLYKPSYGRLAKIFSYIINFVRFRESQTSLIDEHFNKTESVKALIEKLCADNHDNKPRIERMRRNRKAAEAEVSDKTTRNEHLKGRVNELRRSQEKMATRFEDVKQNRSRLTGLLEQRTVEKLTYKQESAKLGFYTLQDPSALHDNLAEMREKLNNLKAHLDVDDRRVRALRTTIDSIAVVKTHVASCTKMCDEVATEQAKENDEMARSEKQRDALLERGNHARELERAETMLRRPLATWTERIDKLREQSSQKAHEAKEKMHELRAVHKRQTEERTDDSRELEIRRVRIEQTEKKMLDLKEKIENEVHAAQDGYLKMEAHIKLYITEMEQTVV